MFLFSIKMHFMLTKVQLFVLCMENNLLEDVAEDIS